jgi:hypothetical protein
MGTKVFFLNPMWNVRLAIQTYGRRSKIKTFLTTTSVAVVLVFGGGIATAISLPAPQDPCANNPTTLCDGNATFVNEPAGPNCTYGGVRIEIQRGKKDDVEFLSAEVVEDDQPEPDPKDEVLYVCNGVPAISEPGIPGIVGPSGPPGAPGPSATLPRRCLPSVRLNQRLVLPSSLRNNKKVRLVVQGPNAKNVRFNKNVQVRTRNDSRQFIRVPMRNRNCGSYIITVSAPGAAKSVTQIWTVTGLFGLKRVKV